MAISLIAIHYLCQTPFCVVRKFFPHDKNYLLEEAQLRMQDCLLTRLIDQAVGTYQQMHNPLGLNDAFSEKISHYYPQNLTPLYPFYQNLAGVYRFKFGENQLGFLWDGKDHSEKYQEDWEQTFEAWIDLLCKESQFAQAVLDLTVFLPENQLVHMAGNRLNAVMMGVFDLKMHRKNGLVAS